MKQMMYLNRFAASVAIAGMMASPIAMVGQSIHARAKAQQEAQDRRHHTKAKIVAGSAAGGAVTGALIAGPVGALVGAGVGAGGGLIANKIRKHHGIRKKMRRMAR